MVHKVGEENEVLSQMMKQAKEPSNSLKSTHACFLYSIGLNEGDESQKMDVDPLITGGL